MWLNSFIDARKNTSYIKLSRIVPTLFEAIGLLILAISVVFIGNTRELLDYYGLGGSNQVIEHSTGHAITAGLSKLDTYSLTDRIVTFIVWAFIGVLCFSVVQVLGRLYHDFDQEQKVSSNRYIHPNTFRRSVFWRQVLVSFLTTSFGLIFLVLGLYCLLAYVLPICLTYTRSFLIGGNLAHAGSFILGFFMLFGWLLLLSVVIKFMLNRHRLLNR